MSWYTPSGNPLTQASGLSSTIRAEFQLIKSAFDSLPSSFGTIAGQAANAVAITGGTINGTAIGGSTPAAGAFTTLSATGAVSGAGITALFASPPAIGGTAAAAGAFTTLAASGAVSGAGFTAFMASPPAIGGTAPAAGTFTTLGAYISSGAQALMKATGGDTHVGFEFRGKGQDAIHKFTNDAGGVELVVQAGGGGQDKNWFQVQGAVSGGGIPTLIATGDGTDAYVQAKYISTGIGNHWFETAAPSAVRQFGVMHVASASRYARVWGSNGANPKIDVTAGSLDIGSPVVFTSQTVGTTVGAAGGASALPATPLGYMTTSINGTACKIPYYTA